MKKIWGLLVHLGSNTWENSHECKKVEGMEFDHEVWDKIVEKCAEAGVVMTPAGATFPYGKDPKDSNIRIAPSFPTPEELAAATEVFVLSVKLVSAEKLLENM